MIRNNHFEGLCCAIRNAARLVTMTEQEDIGTTVSTNAVYAEKSAEESVYLFLYDQYTGGLGYAEKAYELIPEIIENGIAMVSGCPCEDAAPPVSVTTISIKVWFCGGLGICWRSLKCRNM